MVITATNYSLTIDATNSAGTGSGTASISAALQASVTRNVFYQPFASNSIWNHPIGKGGSGATLNAAGTGPHGGAQFKYSDGTGPVYEKASATATTYTNNDEVLILMGPSSPTRQLFTNTVAWNSNPAQPARCSASQTATGTFLPIPAQAVYTDVQGSLPNCCACILNADRHTLEHNQPLQICSVGGLVTTEFFFPNSDLFTDGIAGSHGGSGMSEIGGCIRMNELMPGNSPIVNGIADPYRHAIGVAFPSGWFNQFGTRFFPATNNDTGNESLFLALLPSFNYNALRTPPGRAIAWSCINYGWYLVDADGGASFPIMNLPGEYSYMDSSINCPQGRLQNQFSATWGYNFASINSQTLSSWPFGQDLIDITNNLYAITNNSASAINGDTSGGVNMLQPFMVAPTDAGVISSAPIVATQSFSLALSQATTGHLIGVISAQNAPYSWSLSGTNNLNFWVRPTTGELQVSATGPGSITAQTYTLTASATNRVGTTNGTINITVS